MTKRSYTGLMVAKTVDEGGQNITIIDEYTRAVPDIFWLTIGLPLGTSLISCFICLY